MSVKGLKSNTIRHDFIAIISQHRGSSRVRFSCSDYLRDVVEDRLCIYGCVDFIHKVFADVRNSEIRHVVGNFEIAVVSEHVWDVR